MVGYPKNLVNWLNGQLHDHYPSTSHNHPHGFKKLRLRAPNCSQDSAPKSYTSFTANFPPLPPVNVPLSLIALLLVFQCAWLLSNSGPWNNLVPISTPNPFADVPHSFSYLLTCHLLTWNLLATLSKTNPNSIICFSLFLTYKKSNCTFVAYFSL